MKPSIYRRILSIITIISCTALILWFTSAAIPPKTNPYNPDYRKPKAPKGMKLVWNDEFNRGTEPDTAFWRYEKGFVRNQELQWYQEDNASVANGVLLIEGRREKVKNPGYVEGSSRWNQNREYAEYTSSSIQTRGKKDWKYGVFEIRARVDTSKGSWPAIWMLGNSGGWPAGGEIDIMEFYRKDNVPILLSNVAWQGEKRSTKWHTEIRPLSDFTAKDHDWVRKFHTWKMEWDSLAIKLYLDDYLFNTTMLAETVNPDGRNPFLQPQYLLLNLALGANGGDPSDTPFPVRYEVDYVRVYQKK
jgi:beta-glucanase (GH16 family)